MSGSPVEIFVPCDGCGPVERAEFYDEAGSKVLRCLKCGRRYIHPNERKLKILSIIESMRNPRPPPFL